MSKQFTIITLEQRFQASTNRSGSSQLENNHEVQIIADFIVIMLTKIFKLNYLVGN